MNSRKSFNMYIMARGIFIFITLVFAALGADAASVRGVSTAARGGRATATNQTANPASSYTYNYMYPYLNNQMRTTLRPADPTSPSTSPINAVVRTEQLSAPRRVVPRTNVRAATASPAQAPTARAAAVPNTNPTRRVVARAATTPNTTARRTIATRDLPIIDRDKYDSRLETSYAYRSATNAANAENTATTISSARCLADYTECMDRYCVRENMKYNRCFCSAKLSQIDATYQPALESLIKQIIAVKNGGTPLSNAELDAYWMEKIGQYTGDNSWQKIDDLLNINWETMENRTRGQNAFATGHEYCAQHLRGCFYMASNLRDAYRSRISTDCAIYEKSLQQLKNAAESVIEAYQE
jgi:hypothetical protein